MAREIAAIGSPMEGWRTWQVDSVYSNGVPYKYINPAIPDFSVGRWSGDGWVIYSLRGMVVRGRFNKMRIFRSEQGAARAAELEFRARVANVREINEAQRASEARSDYPSHDRSA